MPLEYLDLESLPNEIFSQFNCVICIFSMISKECSIKLCICNQLTFSEIDVKFGKIWWIFQDIMQYSKMWENGISTWQVKSHSIFLFFLKYS